MGQHKRFFFLFVPVLVKNLLWITLEKMVLEVMQNDFIDVMNWISSAKWILVNGRD